MIHCHRVLIFPYFMVDSKNVLIPYNYLVPWLDSSGVR